MAEVQSFYIRHYVSTFDYILYACPLLHEIFSPLKEEEKNKKKKKTCPLIFPLFQPLYPLKIFNPTSIFYALLSYEYLPRTLKPYEGFLQSGVETPFHPFQTLEVLIIECNEESFKKISRIRID